MIEHPDEAPLLGTTNLTLFTHPVNTYSSLPMSQILADTMDKKEKDGT